MMMSGVARSTGATPLERDCLSSRDVKKCFYLGGYGTESHNHLLGHRHREEPEPIPEATPATEAA